MHLGKQIPELQRSGAGTRASLALGGPALASTKLQLLLH